MIGEPGSPSEQLWDDAMERDNRPAYLPDSMPLFARLDIDEVMENEIVSDKTKKENESVEGVAFIDYDTFASVDLRIGRVVAVDDHPNADRLYVVRISEGDGNERTVCAGLKEHYKKNQLLDSLVVFVANLEPRKLRGVMSEGMLLAADDGHGAVRLLRPDGNISPGSNVR